MEEKETKEQVEKGQEEVVLETPKDILIEF
jgi:hypothetical protein